MDAFGELTNIIIGNLKNELEHHTGPMGLSVPTVIHGKNLTARSDGREEWAVAPQGPLPSPTRYTRYAEFSKTTVLPVSACFDCNTA